MSGGFFRGTSADQDTRFSNKAAKLLKTQKFAPELDHLIDMKKVHLDSIRPWIAVRVTQLLGFEDEVLINFIYGLLEEKNANGKQIQIQLTGFMEKNTGKFMKELWGLLTSAQNSTTGIPQQLLDEKAEEAGLKKAEDYRAISEVRKKEDERKVLKQDAIKEEKEDNQLDSFIPEATKQRSHSLFSGRKSPDANGMNMRNRGFQMNAAFLFKRLEAELLNTGSVGYRCSLTCSAVVPGIFFKACLWRIISVLDYLPGLELTSAEAQLTTFFKADHGQLTLSSSLCFCTFQLFDATSYRRLGSRPSQSRSRSISTVSSRSMSRSPPPPRKTQFSGSTSISRLQRFRRSRSPLRRGRSPHHRHRSRSPIRRVRSPVSAYSPRVQGPSHSVSPRPRSPIRSPRRRRSPYVPHSPRARSPVVYSSRRRYSPGYKRVSPRRRTSFHSSGYRRRSPRFAHSPVRHHKQPASPGQCRSSPQHLSDMSPQRRPCISPKAVSPPPRHHIQSLSAETDSKMLPVHLDSLSSPPVPSSTSPHSATHVSSVPQGKASFVSSPQERQPLLEGKPFRVSVSPVYRNKPANEYSSGSPSPMTRSPSPMTPRKGENSFVRNTPDKPVQSRVLALSPPKQQSSPFNEKGQSNRPPTVGGATRDTGMKIKPKDLMIVDEKRSGSSSRESFLSGEGHQVTLLRKPGLLDVSTFNTVLTPVEKVDKPLSKSFNDYQETSDCRKRRNNQDLESDRNGEHDSLSSVSLDDRKAAKRHRKEKRRLHKEERRRKREERHKRKEERRANKPLSKGIASVTPPPHFNKCLPRYDDFDCMDEGKLQPDKDVKIEQRDLESELRKKALDSINAKKVVNI